jgi:hypothetical protein
VIAFFLLKNPNWGIGAWFAGWRIVLGFNKFVSAKYLREAIGEVLNK